MNDTGPCDVNEFCVNVVGSFKCASQCFLLLLNYVKHCSNVSTQLFYNIWMLCCTQFHSRFSDCVLQLSSECCLVTM